MYEDWVKYEVRENILPNQKLVIEMMKKFESHLKDSNNPIVSFAEIKRDQEEKEESRSK